MASRPRRPTRATRRTSGRHVLGRLSQQHPDGDGRRGAQRPRSWRVPRPATSRSCISPRSCSRATRPPLIRIPARSVPATSSTRPRTTRPRSDRQRREQQCQQRHRQRHPADRSVVDRRPGGGRSRHRELQAITDVDARRAAFEQMAKAHSDDTGSGADGRRPRLLRPQRHGPGVREAPVRPSRHPQARRHRGARQERLRLARDHVRGLRAATRPTGWTRSRRSWPSPMPISRPSPRPRRTAPRDPSAVTLAGAPSPSCRLTPRPRCWPSRRAP